MTGLEPVAPCLQSQIGQDRYQGVRPTVQVTAAVVLSVVVRWEPIGTALSGTLVARPPRSPVSGCAVGFTLTYDEVRLR